MLQSLTKDMESPILWDAHSAVKFCKEKKVILKGNGYIFLESARSAGPGKNGKYCSCGSKKDVKNGHMLTRAHTYSSTQKYSSTSR